MRSRFSRSPLSETAYRFAGNGANSHGEQKENLLSCRAWSCELARLP